MSTQYDDLLKQLCKNQEMVIADSHLGKTYRMLPDGTKEDILECCDVCKKEFNAFDITTVTDKSKPIKYCKSCLYK